MVYYLVYSEIAGLVDEGWVVCMVMLVVSHVVLLDKLREIGVCTVLLNWIFFLSDGRVCVVVGGASSSARSVSSSVPQGSVLGPILFLMYVNYLTDGLACQHGAFANDYKVYLHYSRVAGQDGRAALQRDLDSLVAVAGFWNLS